MKGLVFMPYFHHFKEKTIKNVLLFTTIFLSLLSLVSCKGGNQASLDDDSIIKIFYLDTTQTSIVGMDYVPTSKSTSGLIEEFIYALDESPISLSMKKAKPDSVIIQSYNLNENGRLTLDFSPEYNDLEGVSEVLCRATIVKTLFQVDDVQYIDFTINGQPLMDSNDKPVGLIHEDDIIHSTNAEDVYVTIFFSKLDGNALIPSNLRITYDGNISIPELIINRIILGPVESNMIQTVSTDTVLNSVTVKEGICYVNFSEDFLDYNPEIMPEIVIYSIVNSLVELSYINSVQFTINGTVVEDYNGVIFNKPFERKLELIVETS